MSKNLLGDCPKRIYQLALDFCSYSRRDIRRIVSYVTDVATKMTDKKTSKVVDSLREIALVILLVLSPMVNAHKSSDSYMTLEVMEDEIKGRWDIALRDLEYAISVDENGDGAITWGELRAKRLEIQDYAFSRFSATDGELTCAMSSTGFQVDSHTDGRYAVLNFDLRCPSSIHSMAIQYQLFFDLDPTHRGLVKVLTGQDTKFFVFSPEKTVVEIDKRQGNAGQAMAQFFGEGVWHIWIGYDHVLFLICLLLPAVVKREKGRWHSVNGFREASWQVAKIVTAFTIAHSLTLAMAVLGLVELPSRLVESAVAFSVILAAANNLFPVFTERAWQLAFVFGLVHGFGFAGVLSELGLTTTLLGISLLGFNLGVEAGQIAIVALFLPLAFMMRNRKFYQPVVIGMGSQAIMIVALVWFVQRAFNLDVFQS